MKDVKSDRKWEINFCSKQLVILSSLSAFLATLNFRRFLIRRMSLPPRKIYRPGECFHLPFWRLFVKQPGNGKFAGNPAFPFHKSISRSKMHRSLLQPCPTSGFPQGISRNPARNQPDYKKDMKKHTQSQWLSIWQTTFLTVFISISEGKSVSLHTLKAI